MASYTSTSCTTTTTTVTTVNFPFNHEPLPEVLNQKWEKIVRPKVAITRDELCGPVRSNNDTFGDTLTNVLSKMQAAFSSLLSQEESKKDPIIEKLEGIARNYKFGAIIDEIKLLRSQGNSMCLFVGKTVFEKLPPDEQKANPNEVWVSGDVCLQPHPSATPDYLREPTRLHLWLDFNQQEGLEMIQGLFDKIAIGCSTAKFFENNFTMRFSSLLQGPESTMAFPNPVQVSMATVNKVIERFDPSRNSYHSNFEDFIKLKKVVQDQSPGLSEDLLSEQMWLIHDQKGHAYMKAHLETIYEEVKLCNAEFPHESCGVIHYFIVRGKKRTS